MEQTNNSSCPHLEQLNQDMNAKTANGCEECIQIGSSWVSLRLCLSCGHVGCCDSSPNKHATKHFERLNTNNKVLSTRGKVGVVLH